MAHRDDESFERGKPKWQHAQQLPDVLRWDMAQIEDKNSAMRENLQSLCEKSTFNKKEPVIFMTG